MAKQTVQTINTSSSGLAGPAKIALYGAAFGSFLLGFGLLISLWWRSGPPDPYETLRIASREFVKGRIGLAGSIAETVTLDSESPDDQPWDQLKQFLIAASLVDRADREDDVRQQRILLEEALPVLRQSEAVGYPQGRQSEGERMFGIALYKAGRFDEAAVKLSQAVGRDPTMTRELAPMLAQAQLRSLKTEPLKSLETIRGYQRTASLDPAQSHEATMIEIRALMGLRLWNESEDKIVKAIGDFESDVSRLRGDGLEYRDELRLNRAVVTIQRLIERYGPGGPAKFSERQEVSAQLEPAIDQLAEVEREASPHIASQAKLWAARAFLCEGNPELALTQLTAVRQQRPFGADATAGGLEEIELLAAQGRGLEALQTTRYIVRELGDPRGFDPKVVSFEEFRRRLGRAIEKLRQAGEYAYAVDISRSLPPLFEAYDALLQEAASYQEWAEATLRSGTNSTGDVNRASSITAREHFRAAGDAYAAAAKIDFDTPRYLDTLWLAIDAYQNGRNFSRSSELLEDYLRYEERRRQPRGMVAMGRALLADGEAARAIEKLTQCIIEFPRDPLRYDARLLSALAHAELGNLDDAMKLLQENLEDGELTPESPAWRDSLFSLGEIAYRRARSSELDLLNAKADDRPAILRANQPNIRLAIRYLNEAVERYWPSERAQMAAYFRSCSHRMAAAWPQQESSLPDVLDAARRTLRAQAEAELEQAREGFGQLSKHLTKQEEESRLSDGLEQLLRNCLFAEADILREMELLDKAESAYRAISIRYMNEPLALEAMMGQAWCVKQLGRTRESEGLIRQALVVLSRIPPDLDSEFDKVTRYDRPGWERLLTWMTSRFDAQATSGV